MLTLDERLEMATKSVKDATLRMNEVRFLKDIRDGKLVVFTHDLQPVNLTYHHA